MIKEYVACELYIGGHHEQIKLVVTNLASSNIFLGYDWLKRHNPKIDWQAGMIRFDRCREQCGWYEEKETLDTEKVRNVQVATEPTIPEHLKEFGEVFSEESFEKLPEH